MADVGIDRDLCIGSGNCIHFAPGTFALDDEGIATVRPEAEPTKDQIATVVAQCPTGAISVEP